MQQTVTREPKAIQEQGFLGHSIFCISDVNVVPKRAATILSEGISKYFLSSLCSFIVLVRELDCHTVYHQSLEGSSDRHLPTVRH
jgi:hypothetical protein